MHEASFPKLQGSRTKESRRATKQKRETEREREGGDAKGGPSTQSRQKEQAS